MWKYIFGYDDALTRMQLKILKNEIKAKGRSLAERKSTFSKDSVPYYHQISEIRLLQMEKEMPEHLLICSICCSAYSKKNRIPLVGTCGHTICGRCVTSIRIPNCPICRADDSFRKPSKNFLAYGEFFKFLISRFFTACKWETSGDKRDVPSPIKFRQREEDNGEAAL